MKIVGTGLSGLVGSRVVELLSPDYAFENLSLETGIDITKQSEVQKYIGGSDAPWVFHFAARTDVDGAEKERQLGSQGPSWIVNVTATDYVTRACKASGKKLLYISTDYVFDGTKDSYTEADSPNPLGWYAVTKYEGEKVALSLGDNALIIRIANPYRANFPLKPDFVHKIKALLSEGKTISAPSDQLFVPTFVDDIAASIRLLVEKNAHGIFHVVGQEALTPYDAANAIKTVFDLPGTVEKTTFASYFQNRAPRPFRAVLKNDKITKFGVSLSSFSEGLEKVKAQE